MLEKIELSKGIWEFDSSKELGPGGFGYVYEGYSKDYGKIAIKKIKTNAMDRANREIRIANELISNTYVHIIPFYDAGYDKKSGLYYLVMPCAICSLQDKIKTTDFSEIEVINILLQIAEGLAEVPNLIHRDLKPGNILYSDGVWKISDFGIAKFVEETTSLLTLRGCLTPAYAAPEQWTEQLLTNAVDIYSLGIIGYTLLLKHPPFEGSGEELKEKHLHSNLPQLYGISPLFDALLKNMTRKNPKNRPSVGRVIEILSQISANENNNKGFEILSKVAEKISEEEANNEVKDITEHDLRIQRQACADEAQEILTELIDSLFQKIITHVINASVNSDKNKKELRLGDAILTVDLRKFPYIQKDVFSKSKWDVLTGGIIQVIQKKKQDYIWSANLWYTNLGENDSYRWWEVMYMTSPLMRSSKKFEPYAETDLDLADRGAAKFIMDIIQLGSTPKAIDLENEEDFVERWVTLFAKAANGELCRPSSLPIR